jgi:hypothetical protein
MTLLSSAWILLFDLPLIIDVLILNFESLQIVMPIEKSMLIFLFFIYIMYTGTFLAKVLKMIIWLKVGL